MMDAGEDAVLDWILLEDAKMMQGFLEKMERMFWVLPDASDTTSMWGVGNYIVYVDGATGSFASTLPNGYSDKQGLAVTDLNGRYGNWSDTYVNISEEDLIDKMQSGMFHTKFVPPMQNPILHSGVDRAFYCEHSTVRAFGRKLKGQNDNLGPDVAWGEGKAVINGAPLVPVPALEQGTVAANLVDSAGTALSGPIWQIDWAQFKVCALRGNWMRKTPPRESPTQSTVVVRHVYATANITDVNPRALAVYAK